MANQKPGNALLKRAFADLPQLDIGPHTLMSEREFNEDIARVRKISSIPSFEDEDFAEFFEAPFLDNGAGYGSRTVGNPHKLAWYVPYHLGAYRKWGIHFDAVAMTSYAEAIYRRSRITRKDISRATVHTFAWSQVLRHELEHCTQELTIATAIDLKKIAYADLYAKYELGQINREGLATHFEFADLISTRRVDVKKVSPYLNTISSGFDLLPGYSEWDSLKVSDVEAEFEFILGLDPALVTTHKLRELMDAKASSRFISVPLYVEKTNHGNWHNLPLALDFKMSGISCKKVSRALQNKALQMLLHQELEIRSGGQHPQVLTRPNSRAASVPMVCHKNDPIHRDFFKQLAALVDKDKMQVVQIIKDAI